ncbi:MarR family winged helix-turn-helix transcriptional regulator [Clostridioides difficile]|uniref:MarR family winged helix-turn-helix transcriptional regulator n=1 Tax=Clostridioides difficile TaxID=1496 RepID=UPI00355BD355
MRLISWSTPNTFFFKDERWAKSKELADKRKVKASTTTVMIKRMEKAGLVERKQDEKDQRVSRIFLTDKGLEICNKVEEFNKELEREFFLGFSEEEKIVLRRLLMQVRDNLKAGCHKHEDEKYF